MIVTEICVSCNDEKNCNEINYETMKCNDCSISMPKKYIRDIRFCQHCYYFKYSSFWFDVLSKNMCYECASSDTYDTKEKQEQIKNYRHIICKLPAIQELPEERPRYKRKYEKSENDTQNQNQNVKHKRVRKVITQVCTVCLEEKSSKYWCNASKNITCPACYYKEKKNKSPYKSRKQRTCILCKCCKETKMSFNWYNNGMCDDCYKPKKI